MSIEIKSFNEADDDWNHYLKRSPQSTVFHRQEVLETIENHSDSALRRLVGYKGHEPVGVFPLFKLQKAQIPMIFSPPPRFGIEAQGPILLNYQNLKQRKFERRHRRFITKCLEYVSREFNPWYYRFVTTTNYHDPRPFEWDEFTVTPRHTYTLDLSEDTEKIKKSFSKSLRRYLDPEETDRFKITEEGEEGIEFIHEQIKSRWEAQGRSYSISLDFLTDLYHNLPEGHFRPYIGTVDGERASGMIILQDDDTIYFSEGGGKPDVDFPINDLLHWQIIQDAKERDVAEYDLYGANTPRICGYKSKFNADLRTYYEIERGNVVTRLMSKVYRRLQ